MRRYKKSNLDQLLLLPPNLREWVPEGHDSLVISDIVDELDLTHFYKVHEEGNEDGDGKPPYDPRLLVKLLIYAYGNGVYSSRKIERRTWEDVAFRVMTGDLHPDHDTIATFRTQFEMELAQLFVQVLKLCDKAGLVGFVHIAIDGSKIKANASKHKAMSYGRMKESEDRLLHEIEALLAEAKRVDDEEDAKYGKGVRGDEIPKELRRRGDRLKRIREAMRALEEEARAEAARKAEDAKRRIAERERKEKETGKRIGGKPPQVPDVEGAKPDPKAQRNFTDPDSRIMKDGATKSFVQAYNAEAAVDSKAQIIVAWAVTQEPNDKRQLVPMARKVFENTGRRPEAISADNGFYSEEAVTHPIFNGVRLLVPPEKVKHGDGTPEATGDPPADATVAERMRHLLRTPEGRDTYKMRKAIAEPPFGQIKEDRGFRRFSCRGKGKADSEWSFVCTVSNVFKLIRSGWRPASAGSHRPAEGRRPVERSGSPGPRGAIAQLLESARSIMDVGRGISTAT